MKNNVKDKILALRKEGKSYSQIAKELSCSQGTISYHCSEGGKERAKIRSKKRTLTREKCQCGNFKRKLATFCSECSLGILRKSKRQKILESTIESYYKSYTSNTKHTSIRRLARVIAEENKIEKKCKICGFDDYVELCHIKQIKDFNKTDTISEVNAVSNLTYLCPNHHKLLDTGKIKL